MALTVVTLTGLGEKITSRAEAPAKAHPVIAAPTIMTGATLANAALSGCGEMTAIATMMTTTTTIGAISMLAELNFFSYFILFYFISN